MPNGEMDIVDKDGKKIELPVSAEEQEKARSPKEGEPEAKAQEKAEEKPVPNVSCSIDENGVMIFRANLRWIAESGSAKEYYAFMGYMDGERNRAALIIQTMREEIEKQRAKILQVKNKGLFNGFLNKMRRR